MNTLILKLNATGDVVRTTSMLNRLDGEITWVTAAMNVSLVEGLKDGLRCVAWEDRESVLDRHYDLLLGLEDEATVGEFAARVECERTFGAYLDAAGEMAYTDDARGWFDLSLISRHGRERADQLKFENRSSFQALLFDGLGWRFDDDPYCLPAPSPTGLTGDVAIAPVAGPVWPMKGWAHYASLQSALEAAGYQVNVLPRRDTLLEHLADVAGHRCLVSGDSLPMHLALGSGVPCVTLLNCTSPWEIHDYGLQTQLVSPLLEEHFYSRAFDERAMTAISLEAVLEAVQGRLETAPLAQTAGR